MRASSIVGLVLIILGVLALAVRSITYFSNDQVVGPMGFFAWDVQRPHTIFINPIAGIAAIAAGFAIAYLGRRRITE